MTDLEKMQDAQKKLQQAVDLMTDAAGLKKLGPSIRMYYEVSINADRQKDALVGVKSKDDLCRDAFVRGCAVLSDELAEKARKIQAELLGGEYLPTVQPAPAQEPKKMQLRGDGFPRRNCIDLYTPAEAAISAAVDEVEKAGAHPLLTEAVTLLGQAKDRVADFVELDSNVEANLQTA